MVSTRKWWFLLKHNQNDFVVKEFHIISMRTLIALSFVRDVFTNGQTYPTPRSLAGRRRSRRFSNHSLLFCPLPPPPQCVIIALSFSNVCKISTFDPLKAFFVLSNGTLITFGRFSVPQSAIGNFPCMLPKSASDGSTEKSGFRASTRTIFDFLSWFCSRKARISAFEATPGFLASSKMTMKVLPLSY